VDQAKRIHQEWVGRVTGVEVITTKAGRSSWDHPKQIAFHRHLIKSVSNRSFALLIGNPDQIVGEIGLSLLYIIVASTLFSYKNSGSRSRWLAHSILSNLIVTEEKRDGSRSSENLPIPRYGETSKTFSSPFAYPSKSLKSSRGFTLFTDGYKVSLLYFRGSIGKGSSPFEARSQSARSSSL